MLVTVKEWLKSVLNYRSYTKNETGYPFFGPPCRYTKYFLTAIIGLIKTLNLHAKLKAKFIMLSNVFQYKG